MILCVWLAGAGWGCQFLRRSPELRRRQPAPACVVISTQLAVWLNQSQNTLDYNFKIISRNIQTARLQTCPGGLALHGGTGSILTPGVIWILDEIKIIQSDVSAPLKKTHLVLFLHCVQMTKVLPDVQFCSTNISRTNCRITFLRWKLIKTAVHSALVLQIQRLP